MRIGRLRISIIISWEKKYMGRVKDALREGAKLKAIKIYKEATGLGLRESKEAVDLLCPKYLKRLPIFDELAKYQAEQINK